MEAEERQGLQKDLAERTKTLRTWQAKAEKRGQLKGKLEELRAENEALRAAAAHTSPGNTPHDDQDDDDAREFDVPDLEPEPIDDTLELEVEEPTLDGLIDDMRADRAKRSATARTFRLDSPSPRTKRSATARTFRLHNTSPARSATSRTMSFDMGARRKSSPSRASSYPFAASRAAQAGPSTGAGTRSKYFGRPQPRLEGGGERAFPNREERLARTAREAIGHNDPEDADGLSREKTWRDLTSAEQLSELGDPTPSSPQPRSRVLVDNSSPLRAPKRPIEVIEIGSSPDIPRTRTPLEHKRSEPTQASKGPNILDYLGVDSRGRQRGVVTGTKIRRRA